MTEGYIWTGQYPEAQRIMSEGNNQSMELSEKFLDATWSKDNNGKPQFFIINEAIISKLCILGEDCEPCFEGANITKPTIQFSLDESFKNQLFSMMEELKELLKEGGTPVYNTYAVEIGDALWNSVYDHLRSAYPDPEDNYCSLYYVEGIYEENGQKFAILRSRDGASYYRLDFVLNEENGFVASEQLVEVTKTFTPAEQPQFSLEAIEEYENTFKAKKEEEKEEEPKEDDETCEKCGKPISECECEKEEEEEKKKKYSLEEIPEYVELQTQYADLAAANNDLSARLSALEAENSALKEFKAAIEKKEKEEMINSFYMLSDEDKKDVFENIDTYSVNDIEAKLSILCVRNRVSFNLEEENKPSEKKTTFNLNEVEEEDSLPAWVKAVKSVQNNM
jgi:hypothetical protein